MLFEQDNKLYKQDLKSFEQHIVAADNSTLRITASWNRLLGSVVEHWIIDPAARVRFPPKPWAFFSLIYICFFLCYDFHVV